jgi:radical SAM-linked protein
MKGIKARISPPCELPVTIIEGRPTAIAPSHAEFDRVASQPLLCYACGLECDLAQSREHLAEAQAMLREVRTYEERIAGVKDLIEQPLVELQGLGIRDQRLIPLPEPKSPTPLFRYRATYEKGEEVKYLSHLDLTRALPRAFRRAKIRLGYSQGYHPMPLIQYGPALGVGTVGLNELIDFDSPEDFEERSFLDRINKVLPPGLRFRSLLKLSAGAQSLIKGINRAEYSIPLDASELESAVDRIRAERVELASLDARGIHGNLIEFFMAQEKLVIERVRKDKRQRVDVRRYTKRLNLIENQSSLSIVTEVSPNGGVKPIEVMAAVYGLTETETTSLSSRVRRLRLFSEDQTSDPASWMQSVAAARMSEQGEKLRVTTSRS